MIRLIKSLLKHFRPDVCWHCAYPYMGRKCRYCPGCGYARHRVATEVCKHHSVEPKAFHNDSVVTEKCRSCGQTRHRTAYYLGPWMDPDKVTQPYLLDATIARARAEARFYSPMAPRVTLEYEEDRTYFRNKILQSFMVPKEFFNKDEKVAEGIRHMQEKLDAANLVEEGRVERAH